MLGMAGFERCFEHSLQYHRVPCIIRCRGGRGWGGWRDGLTLPVDTVNQLCAQKAWQEATVVSDHTMNWADVQWNRIGLQFIPLMPLSGLTVSILVLCPFTGSQKPSVKADLLIYSSFVTVSGQCLSVVIIIIKWISIFVHTWRFFLNPVTYVYISENSKTYFSYTHHHYHSSFHHSDRS